MKANRSRMNSDFDLISNYILSKYGFRVRLCSFTPGGICDFAAKEIVVNSSLGIEKRLYVLLHEIGHVLIRWNWKKFEKEFPAHAGRFEDGRISRSKKFRVSTIEEEFEAWKRGKRVASRLGVIVNEEKFNKFKCECLMTYIKWTSDPYTYD